MLEPLLEDPILWGGVHDLLISALHCPLNRALPGGYVARVEECVYLETKRRFNSAHLMEIDLALRRA